MWQSSQNLFLRRLKRSSAALVIGGLAFLGWGALRLIWNSSELVTGKTSNINVFESRADSPSPTPTPIHAITPTPSPQPTPKPTEPKLDSLPVANPYVTFTIADNTLNQQMFKVKGFSTNLLTADAVSLVASSNPEPTYISPDTPAELPETREEVNLFWPSEMAQEGSESFIIILRNKAGAPISPGNVAGYKSGSFAVENVQKSPELRAYASASVSASTFDSKSGSLEWQSLDDAQIKWVWNIAAKNSGRQRLNAAIKVQVKDKAGNVVSEKQIWQGDASVEVYRSWWKKDSVNLTSLLQLLFGAGLTVPWIYERVKKRNQRQRHETRKLTPKRHRRRK